MHLQPLCQRLAPAFLALILMQPALAMAALDLLKISHEDLDPSFGPPTGLTKFLSDAEGAQLLSF